MPQPPHGVGLKHHMKWALATSLGPRHHMEWAPDTIWSGPQPPHAVGLSHHSPGPTKGGPWPHGMVTFYYANLLTSSLSNCRGHPDLTERPEGSATQSQWRWCFGTNATSIDARPSGSDDLQVHTSD